MSVISFYASHIITAGGGGGMVMFNEKRHRLRALMFRDWGRIGNNSEDPSARFGHKVDGIEYDFKFLYGVLGYNMKSTEMNAAFGLVQMDKLAGFKAIRKANINHYVEILAAAETSYVLPMNHDDYDWLAFPLMHKDRGGLLRFLEARDVQVRVTFSGNITRHPAYRHYLNDTDFPIADRIMAEGASCSALTTASTSRWLSASALSSLRTTAERREMRSVRRPRRNSQALRSAARMVSAAPPPSRRTSELPSTFKKRHHHVL